MIQRRRQNFPNDEVRSDGDTGFIGVNMKLAPDKLPPGYVAKAVNKTFRTGLAETRGGAVTPVHMNPNVRRFTLATCDHLIITVTHTEQDANGSIILSMECDQDLTAAPVSADLNSVQTAAGGNVATGTGAIVVMAAAPAGSGTARTNSAQLYVNLARLRTLLGASEDLTWRCFFTYDTVLDFTPGRGWFSVEATAYDGGSYGGITNGAIVLSGATAGQSVSFESGTLDESGILTETFCRLSSETGDTLSLILPTTTTNTEDIFPDYARNKPLPRSILCTGRWTDDESREFLLAATPVAVWQLRFGRTPTRHALPESAMTSGDFTSFAGQVFLWRGTDATPLVWDGDGDWEVYAPSSLPTGFLPMPNAATAEVIGNRLAVIRGRDEVVLSDVLALRYDSANAVFKINQGSDDALVRVLPFTATSLLCFKSQSIFLLENIYGDLSEVRLTEVNRGIGLSGRRAVAQVGADVFFLSQTGIYRVSQVVESRIATAPVPVSDPMEPFFRKLVDWSHAASASMCVADEYVYLLIRCHEQTDIVPRRALVPYNLTSQAFEGWHEFESAQGGDSLIGLDEIFVALHRGQTRLFARDEQQGVIYLLNEGHGDYIFSTEYGRYDELLTRGYALEGAGFKTFAEAEVTLQTSRPSFTVKLESDGVNETSTLCTARTKSRTASYLFGQSDYTLTNTNDDHAREGRQDYAVVCSDSAQPKSGFYPDLQQQAAERFPIRRRGRYAQLRITNSQGRCDLVQARVEGRHHEPLTRTAAT